MGGCFTLDNAAAGVGSHERPVTTAPLRLATLVVASTVTSTAAAVTLVVAPASDRLVEPVALALTASPSMESRPAVFSKLDRHLSSWKRVKVAGNSANAKKNVPKMMPTDD